VKADPDDRWMSEAPETPDDPEPAQVGVLVLRVWQGGTREEPRLYIRLISREDVTKDVTETASASTAEDALARTRVWLQRFCDAPCREPRRWRRRTSRWSSR
jgi:hypothetical protein